MNLFCVYRLEPDLSCEKQKTFPHFSPPSLTNILHDERCTERQRRDKKIRG